jgi:tetratricopeptide (TPR) repeat protein
VASIENRKDLLAALFGLTSILLYRSRTSLGWVGSLAALLLALQAKDAAAIGVVGLLPLAGLLPWPAEDVPWSERVALTRRRLVPLVAIAIAAKAFYGGNLGARLRPEAIEFTTGGACTSYGEVLGTSAAALPDAARLLVLPVRLSADYPTRPQAAPLTGPALAGIALALAAAAVALVLARRAPVAAFAVAWAGITWLPVSNVVPLTAYFVAERYLYLPSFGVCLLVALGLEGLLGRRRPVLVLVAAALVAAGAARSLARVRDWRDDLSLWTAALRAVPEGSARIHAELGRALLTAGRPGEALPHLEKAAELRPARADVLSDLGVALLQSGRAADAVPVLRRALDRWPDSPLARLNLAHALLATGQRDEAVSLLRAAADDDAWRQVTPHVQAALAARGMTPEEFRDRVRRWLQVHASPSADPAPAP